MGYPEIISLSCCRAESDRAPQIFPIYECDSLSPTQGEKNFQQKFSGKRLKNIFRPDKNFQKLF